MPKGKTSRPTNRATKKVMRRTKNKSVQKHRGDAGHFEHNLATSNVGDGSLPEKQEMARKAGAAFDRAAARQIKEMRDARKRKRQSR